MKKKRFGKKKLVPITEVALQITSMADIFTILLVFLLKSFATEVNKIAPHNSIQLPISESSVAIVDTLKLEIAENVILLDDKVVSELTHFKFDVLDIEANGTPRNLNQTFLRKSRAQAPGAGSLNQLMVLADEKTPFATLKKILASASLNGFEDFRLVVVDNK